jgi:hypothetical protein
MTEAIVAPPPAAQPSPNAQPSTVHPTAGSDAFGALDAIATETESPEPSPKPDKSDQSISDRRKDGTFLPKTEKPAEKPEDVLNPEDKAKPSDKLADKPAEVPPEKMAPKQLREAYENLRRKHQELESEHTKIKTAPKPEPVEDTEKKQLSEKRLQEVEDELRFTAYEKSSEYKEKFEAPFVDAFIAGRNKVAGMKTVAVKDPDTETVIEPSRQGTAEDFDALMKISDDDAASDWAVAKFGAKAPMVLFHRERVQETNLARSKAIDEYRKNGSQREKERGEQLETYRKTFNEAVTKASKDAEAKHAKWFAKDDADAPGNEILEKGQHLVARVLANGAPVKEGDKPMSPPELAAAVAAIRHKAGAFDRLAHRHAAAQKEIKALKTKLEAFEKSEPGPGEGGRVGHVDSGTPSLEGALSKLEKDYARG